MSPNDDPASVLASLPPPEELPPNVLQQMSAMINALQNCRALLLTKNAEIKELEAKMHRLSSAQANSGTETLAAMAARKNVQEEVELLAQALQTAEASQAAVGQELQEEIARSRSLRCVHTYIRMYIRMYVCICMYIYVYVCMYVCTHTQAGGCRQDCGAGEGAGGGAC